MGAAGFVLDEHNLLFFAKALCNAILVISHVAAESMEGHMCRTKTDSLMRQPFLVMTKRDLAPAVSKESIEDVVCQHDGFRMCSKFVEVAGTGNESCRGVALVNFFDV